MPSWAHAAGVLREGGGLLSPLARLLTFSFLVGNTDHHAKNIGFLRYVDGTVRLASAYDVAAHLHHPGPHWFALDVAGRRDAAEVTIGDVLAEVTAWGIDAVRARAAVVDAVSYTHLDVYKRQGEEYAAEAEQRWGDTAAWKQSQERTAGYTKADWERIKAEGDAVNAQFARLLDAGTPCLLYTSRCV